VTDPIAQALDAFVPAFESVDGSWEAVLNMAAAAGDVAGAPPSHGRLARLWVGQRWPRRLLAVAIAVAALAGAGVGIAAGFGAFSGSWNTRCREMPAEAPVPAALRAQVHRSFPWVPLKDAGAIHVGPVWLFALSSHTKISRDGDGSDAQRRYLHRTLVAVGPNYTRRVTISGSRLGTQGPRTKLRFTQGTKRCTIFGPTWCARSPLHEAPNLTVAAGTGWRAVRTEIAIGRTGCFALRARGPGLNTSLPLAVPGPDWGTPGW
jgi:hypothetical protein